MPRAGAALYVEIDLVLLSRKSVHFHTNDEVEMQRVSRAGTADDGVRQVHVTCL